MLQVEVIQGNGSHLAAARPAEMSSRMSARCQGVFAAASSCRTCWEEGQTGSVRATFGNGNLSAGLPLQQPMS